MICKSCTGAARAPVNTPNAQELNQSHIQCKDPAGASTSHYIINIHAICVLYNAQQSMLGHSPPQPEVYLSKFNYALLM